MSTSANLEKVQYARRAVVGIVILVLIGLMVFNRAWPNDDSIRNGVLLAGVFAAFICVVGRCWCTLYIGGRKASEIVTVGPYSLCRNPLYTFSIIGSWGFGAQSGSIVVGILSAVVMWAVVRMTVAREEHFLAEEYGQPYRDYLASTPRFFPNFGLWRGVETLTVKPQLVHRTFMDSLFFFVAIPIAAGVRLLQDAGLMPALLHLP